MDIWDNMKYNNICILRVPEKEERKQGTENLFEIIMTELVKEKDTQVQKVKRVPNKMSPKGLP